jgi:aldose 1-epimerase
MWTPALLSLLAATALAQYGSNSTLGPDENGKYEIKADGIRGLFIPYGASVSNLFIKGKDGVERDIVLGFDNATAYEGEVHPHLGGVPGRYANRIKNSSFVIDGETFNVLPNENNNNDTLHGGPNGWDYRNFTIVSHTTDSITFSIVDPDGEQGFPGEVVSYITYTMTPNTWKIKIVAMATTKKTPIMLTSHVRLVDHILGRETDLHRPTGIWTASRTRTRLLP